MEDPASIDSRSARWQEDGNLPPLAKSTAQAQNTHVVLESSPTTAGKVPRAKAKTAAEDSESEAKQPFSTLALVVPGNILKDDEEEEDGDKKMVPAKAATKKATEFGLSRSLPHKFQTIRPQPR